MKVKYLFIVVYVVFSFTVYSQTNPAKYQIQTAVTSFALEIENINELEHIDWDYFLEAFKKNGPDSPISLSFEYKQPNQLGSTKVDGFMFKVSGISSEAETIVLRSKKIIQEIISKTK